MDARSQRHYEWPRTVCAHPGKKFNEAFLQILQNSIYAQKGKTSPQHFKPIRKSFGCQLRHFADGALFI